MTWPCPSDSSVRLNICNAHPECVALGTRVQIIDPDGDPLRDDNWDQTHEEIERTNLRGRGSAICNPSVMMRREEVLRVGKYEPDTHPAEDLDLFLRLAEAGGQVANLPDVLLKYRAHHSSACHAQHDRLSRVLNQIVLKARSRRGLADDRDAIPPPRRSALTCLLR